VKVGSCPSCGAPVEFNPGGGKVKICEHCHTVVLRGEANLEGMGKVAELLDTDSPLKLEGLRKNSISRSCTTISIVRPLFPRQLS
jgi:hypothetical protein